MNHQLTSAAFWLSFLEKHYEKIIAAAIQILVILVVYFVIRHVVYKFVIRLVRVPLGKAIGELQDAHKARLYALQTVLRSVFGFMLAFIVAIMVLQTVGIEIIPLITATGIAGLAIAMGSQKLVRDVINGFFILMEDQYGVGDYVTLGVVTGTVEELGIRITRVRDACGKLYTIPNADSTQVCNHSRGKLRSTLDVNVATSANLQNAQTLLNEVGQALAKDMPELVLEPFVCEGFTQITGASATVRLIGSVVARYEGHVQLELNSRICDAFEKNNIAFG